MDLMMRYAKYQNQEYFLCGGRNLFVENYLNFRSENILRNIAYLLPEFLAKLISKLSIPFEKKHHPVLINKKTFNRSAVYCRDCNTGWVFPFFSKTELNDYYKYFYWRNRNSHDKIHVCAEINNIQLPSNLTKSGEQLHWILNAGGVFSSVIDFGAGDCSAAYECKYNLDVDEVYVVDKSEKAKQISEKLGFQFFVEIEGAPQVDLVFSSHCIEHVHDFVLTIGSMLKKIPIGGFCFFEVPNIEDIEIFSCMTHTPHTYMLSQNSFFLLEKILPVKVQYVEAVGPRWNKHYRMLKSNARADLRVLLRRTG